MYINIIPIIISRRHFTWKKLPFNKYVKISRDFLFYYSIFNKKYEYELGAR